MRTGNKPANPRCPLGDAQPRAMDIEARKRKAWHEQRILIVSLDDCRLTWPETEIVKQLGEKLHGKKARRNT